MRPGSALHTTSLAALALGVSLIASTAHAESAVPRCLESLVAPLTAEVPANIPAFLLRVTYEPSVVDDIQLVQIDGDTETPIEFERTDERSPSGWWYVVISPRAPLAVGARVVLRRTLCHHETNESEFLVGAPVDLPAPPATLGVRVVGIARAGGVSHYEAELTVTPASGSLDVWAPSLAIGATIGGVDASEQRVFGNVAYLYQSVRCRGRGGAIDEGDAVPVSARIAPHGHPALIEESGTFEIDCGDASFVAVLPSGVRRPLTEAELAELDPDREPVDRVLDASVPNLDAGTLDPDTEHSIPERARSGGCSVSAGTASPPLGAALLAIAALALATRRRRVRSTSNDLAR